MKRFRIKYVRGRYVLHIKGRNGWRRLWGYSFFTESMARTFAQGRF